MKILRKPEAVVVAKLNIMEARFMKNMARVEVSRYSRRLTLWQWIVTGLRSDNPLAVIVFFMLLGIIIAVVIASASILYEIL